MKKSFALFVPFVLAGLLSGCPGQSDQTANTANTVTNSIGMEFVRIPAGSFMMGADKNLEDAREDEMPQHQVTISQPFYLGKYEVTQKEWEAVMGDNPSKFKGENNPVENVSWYDIQTFIERLNQKEGTNKYRLPTEAEWEYAARAGTTTQYSFVKWEYAERSGMMTQSSGDDADSLGRYAWYKDNSEGKTHPVGQKEPNPWGLYDMHGNVWEWVQDWYDENYYAQSPAIDPRGPSGGSLRDPRGPYGNSFRVLRGGSCTGTARHFRSATRGLGLPPSMYNGFRLAFSPGHP
ncbi:MAG: formylglycine-generating enzyme family protein [Zoogloeaceae bacterium]|jgi:formylglycine-generating enzyme required for sulfatase activity|nr:formylglycine-generating enzyme family protein [Zoogloeaceae bacterium]